MDPPSWVISGAGPPTGFQNGAKGLGLGPNLSALCERVEPRGSIRHQSPAPSRSSGSPDAPGRTQGTSPGRKLGHRLRGHPQPKPGRYRQCWGSDTETAA